MIIGFFDGETINADFVKEKKSWIADDGEAYDLRPGYSIAYFAAAKGNMIIATDQGLHVGSFWSPSRINLSRQQIDKSLWELKTNL